MQLGQGFEAEAAGLSAKEMVARKHLQREGSTRLVSPRFQVIVADLDILQATKVVMGTQALARSDKCRFQRLQNLPAG